MGAGAAAGGKVAVFSGLTAGRQVIVSRVNLLQDKQTLVEDNKPAPDQTKS